MTIETLTVMTAAAVTVACIVGGSVLLTTGEALPIVVRILGVPPRTVMILAGGLRLRAIGEICITVEAIATTMTDAAAVEEDGAARAAMAIGGDLALDRVLGRVRAHLLATAAITTTEEEEEEEEGSDTNRFTSAGHLQCCLRHSSRRLQDSPRLWEASSTV